MATNPTPQLQHFGSVTLQPVGSWWRRGLRAGPQKKMDQTCVSLYKRQALAYPLGGLQLTNGKHADCKKNCWHSLLHISAGARSSSSTEAVLEPDRSQSAGSVFVRGVLFDMDGVLCDSEKRSREAAVELFSELGVAVTADDFIPFMGTGEANFLGGVASKYGLTFDPVVAKRRFFEIYISKYARPNSGLGYPGALDLIQQCRNNGLKVAVASSADRIKVDANLAAAGLPQSNFDAIVSADLFKNLKPAPDIFLAAAEELGLGTEECVVIEDALAGVQAARAAGMRCIAVTTTLSEERLLKEGPSLVKEDISKISLSDIRNLKDTSTNLQLRDDASVDMETASRPVAAESALQDMPSSDSASPDGFSTTRRNIVKYGSLAAALGATYFSVTHWKAMSYASPQALVNALFGTARPLTNELRGSTRLEKFKQYIAGLESKGGGQTVSEFQPSLEWLNSAPLRLKQDLRGKLVVLDFWTYCCINCMHILPDLAYLENKYKSRPFTVVGVHSAKFDNEKDLNAIRNAVIRYDVTHPVVNDGDMTLWRQLGVSSWPTLALVSPQGKLIAMFAGEGHREDLDELLEASFEYFGEKGELDQRPIPQVLEKDKDLRLLSSPLKYPGKLATDLENKRIFISDSNHHRIVVTDMEGNFICQVGGGGAAFRDGSFEYAAFDRPQGVAYNPIKNVLYVADTENHALREVSFVSQTVRTLAGNGTKGSDYQGGKTGTSQVLNSPWDVTFHPGKDAVYIAMAGQHQIWEHSISDGVSRVFSGDGYERNLNGRRGPETSFAQPSGLTLSPDMVGIIVADSESSSIRSLDLRTGGSKLLAGGDPSFPENLFQFGDRDGSGKNALLQHPLGVLHGLHNSVYIADSYNHKVKLLDLSTNQVSTIAGTGVAGFADGVASLSQLSEPAGLAQGPDGKIFVADTNNSLIRVIRADLENGGWKLETLELQGVRPPVPVPQSAPRRLRRRPSLETEVVQLDPVSAGKGDLQLCISLPPGFHFTTAAVSKYEAEFDDDRGVTLEPASGVIGPAGEAVIHFSLENGGTGVSTVRISCKVYYCQEQDICLYKSIAFDVPFSNSSHQAFNVVPLPFLVQPPDATGQLTPIAG